MSLENLRAKNKISKKLAVRVTFFVVLVVLIVAGIWIWEQYITVHEVPKGIAPKPSDISSYAEGEFFSEHRKGYNTLLEKSFSSFYDALLGFGISAAIGTSIGIVFARSKAIKEGLTPPLFIMQLLPVPAFAPVVAAITGYGVTTKILIIVLFTVYPFIIAGYDAVANIPKNYTALFSNYNANWYTKFKSLILPSIVPNLLHAMKIASTASIVASIIAELPLTVSSGIGKDIYTSFNNQLIPRVWLSLIIISIISLLFFSFISFLDKYINTRYKYGQFQK
ncbi:ABC transporter permease subunit [Candidatus Dojkabacteria bacterium]|nr:ABC transporter permease subunit [Candidatus Dojkabacteria bacterium]